MLRWDQRCRAGRAESSSIVMAVRHLNPEIALHTFSYIADHETLNEEKWIDIVCTASNAHVHKVHPTPDELMGDFEQLSYVPGLFPREVRVCTHSTACTGPLSRAESK